MEEAAAIRRAALEAVEDVEPEALFERIRDHVREGSMAPGVLTVMSARASRDEAVEPANQAVVERGAGVQLIYDGLRLTRDLATDPPWDTDDAHGADQDVLVADILVARGFYLLARTEAADAAVETVRSFGHDQTVRDQTDDVSLDRALERDVFELAVVAGTTVTGAEPSPKLREYVTDLAANGALDGSDGVFSEAVRDRLATLTSDASDGVATPPTENRNA